MAKFAVGLTGGIGSGKSTVADLFAAQGAAVIDTDSIAHLLTAAGGLAIPHIRTIFGDEYLTAQGAMDRQKMRAAVFTDPATKAKLEAILHPLIRSETERAVSVAHGPYVVIVVPLLVESGVWQQRVSRVLVVDCPEDIQVRRVMQRNGFSEEQVRAIMATQVPRTQRLAVADDVILNDGHDPSALQGKVATLHRRYLALADSH
jgi:dephospho-CoA kinase